MKNYSNEEKLGPFKCGFDFQKKYTEKVGLERSMSLEKALDYAGIAFEGRMHDALCDARKKWRYEVPWWSVVCSRFVVWVVIL